MVLLPRGSGTGSPPGLTVQGRHCGLEEGPKRSLRETRSLSSAPHLQPTRVVSMVLSALTIKQGLKRNVNMKKRIGHILDTLESMMATERRRFTVNKHSHTHTPHPGNFPTAF